MIKIIKNEKKSDFYNGVYDRYQNPVVTRQHVPLHWRLDLNKDTNPHFFGTKFLWNHVLCK